MGMSNPEDQMLLVPNRYQTNLYQCREKNSIIREILRIKVIHYAFPNLLPLTIKQVFKNPVISVKSLEKLLRKHRKRPIPILRNSLIIEVFSLYYIDTNSCIGRNFHFSLYSFLLADSLNRWYNLIN